MKKILALILLILNFYSSAQSEFIFYEEAKKYQDIRFQFINNLIVIPVKVNQKELNFIFDTGVNKTIVFNASPQDSILFNSQRKIKLQGLGSGEPIDAVVSENNSFRIGNMVSYNQTVFITLKNQFDLSSKMGVTIHGVIGYNLLKDVVTQINYRKKRIRFFNAKTYQYEKCRKCKTFPIVLFKNKPYVDVAIKLQESSKQLPVRMLIDSGGSDALWLFEYSKKGILPPTNYFDDVLGEGLSGTIYGKRSRIEGIAIGDFFIKQPTISFLDSISTKNARKYTLRHGSIGSNILKRFHVILDYQNKKMVLKKIASLSGGFEYNMSGMEVVYNGKILIREKSQNISTDSYGRDVSDSSKNSLSFVTNYSYKFKPSFRVSSVIVGSPAHTAGILPNDILLKINGKDTHNMTLNEIVGKLREKNNKKMSISLQRKGVVKKVYFRLRRRL